MINNGYNIRREADGTWTVFDVFNNEPVCHNGVFQCRLTEREANEVLDALRKDFIENKPEEAKPD